MNEEKFLSVPKPDVLKMKVSDKEYNNYSDSSSNNNIIDDFQSYYDGMSEIPISVNQSDAGRSMLSKFSKRSKVSRMTKKSGTSSIKNVKVYRMKQQICTEKIDEEGSNSSNENKNGLKKKLALTDNGDKNHILSQLLKIKMSEEKRNQIMKLIVEDEENEQDQQSPKNVIMVEDFSSQEQSQEQSSDSNSQTDLNFDKQSFHLNQSMYKTNVRNPPGIKRQNTGTRRKRLVIKDLDSPKMTDFSPVLGVSAKNNKSKNFNMFNKENEKTFRFDDIQSEEVLEQIDDDLNVQLGLGLDIDMVQFPNSFVTQDTIPVSNQQINNNQQLNLILNKKMEAGLYQSQNKKSPQSGSERVPQKFADEDPLEQEKEEKIKISLKLKSKTNDWKKKPLPEIKSFSLKSFVQKKLSSPAASQGSEQLHPISDRDESSTFGQSRNKDQEEIRTLTIHDIDQRTFGESDTVKKTSSDLTFRQKIEEETPKTKFNQLRSLKHARIFLDIPYNDEMVLRKLFGKFKSSWSMFQKHSKLQNQYSVQKLKTMKGKVDKLEKLWKDQPMHKKIHKQYKGFLAQNTKQFFSREDELKAITDYIVAQKIDLDKFVLKFYIAQRYDPLSENYPKEIQQKPLEPAVEQYEFYCNEGGNDIIFNNYAHDKYPLNHEYFAYENVVQQTNATIFKEYDDHELSLIRSSHNKNENSIFGNQNGNVDYGSECQVAIPTCEDGDIDDPYEFENVAEGPRNQINSIQTNKMKIELLLPPTKSTVENVSNVISSESIVESNYTYNQSKFAKNHLDSSNYQSSNQRMSIDNTKLSQQKFRMSTDGSNIIVPRDYSTGGISQQRISTIAGGFQRSGFTNPSQVIGRTSNGVVTHHSQINFVQVIEEPEEPAPAKDSKSSNFSMIDRQSVKSPNEQEMAVSQLKESPISSQGNFKRELAQSHNTLSTAKGKKRQIGNMIVGNECSISGIKCIEANHSQVYIKQPEDCDLRDDVDQYLNYGSCNVRQVRDRSVGAELQPKEERINRTPKNDRTFDLRLKNQPLQKKKTAGEALKDDIKYHKQNSRRSISSGLFSFLQCFCCSNTENEDMSRGYDPKKMKLQKTKGTSNLKPKSMKKQDLQININASEQQRTQNNDYIEQNLLSSPYNDKFKVPISRVGPFEPANPVDLLSDSFSSMKIDERIKSNIDSENQGMKSQ